VGHAVELGTYSLMSRTTFSDMKDVSHFGDFAIMGGEENNKTWCFV
jgi:hypothetical protein